MNRKQFNDVHENDVLYCNGMCHNYKGLKVSVLRTENYSKNGEIITVTPIDDRFHDMQGCVYDLSYKSLSVKPL